MMSRTSLILIALLCMAWPTFAAEEKKGGKAQQGPPPTLVAVADVVTGDAEPMQEMVGTVYYSRVSNVAAEVEGVAVKVAVEAGDRVKAGQLLVRLGTDILDTRIAATRGSFEQAQIDLEQARKDLQRLESLHADSLIAETTYDNQAFKTRGLEKKVASLQAALDQLLLEKEKKTIRAPFAGLVLDKKVEKGEWVDGGGEVAIVADDSQVDIIVDVPEQMVGLLEKGRKVNVQAGGGSFEGTYIAFVPRGDIATRTFALKLRMKNDAGLIEGMIARAMLPVDRKVSGLLVPRDAVVQSFGSSVVFAVVDGKAKMVRVQVTGYAGLQLGVVGEGLESGQKVVTKGNERLRDGQPVRFGS